MIKIPVHSVLKDRFGVVLEMVGAEELGTLFLPWSEADCLTSTDHEDYFYLSMEEQNGTYRKVRTS